MLLTANVRDFGAKLQLYEQLLEQGVSVVVIRPGRQTLTPNIQVSIVAMHSTTMFRRAEDAQGPILLRASPSDVKERSLEELRAEIHGEGEGLP